MSRTSIEELNQVKRCCLVLALVYVLIATFPMDASNVGRNLRIEEWGTEIGYFTSDNPLYKSVFQDVSLFGLTYPDLGGPSMLPLIMMAITCLQTKIRK